MMDIWWRDRKRQMTHHTTALSIMKWIIGYNKEIKRLVKRMIDKWEANPENEN